MSEQATPYVNAVEWLSAGVSPAEVVTRLKASGLGAEEISLLLSAAANKVRANGGSVDMRNVAIPVDAADRAKTETAADGSLVPAASGSGFNGGIAFGAALVVIGVGIFIATNGQFIAYGMVLVGIVRIFRGAAGR